MSADFTTVGARARGLQGRLFPRAELEGLAGLEPAALGRALARSPRLTPAPPESASALELELAARRTAAALLRLLARWSSPPSPALEVFFAEQDLLNLRALLRGAMQTAPAAERLAATMPTPTLPVRALAALAGLPTPRAIVAQLVLLSHPDASRLTEPATRTTPEWLELDLALSQGFAARAVAAAHRGDQPLRDFVQRRVDLTNAERALLLAGEARDVAPERFFVEGGRALSARAFAVVARADAAVAGATLARVLKGTSLHALAGEALGDPVRLEALFLPEELKRQRVAARLDPLSSATVLEVLLKLEAQSVDLRRLIHGSAAGAPASLLRPGLVTPWS